MKNIIHLYMTDKCSTHCPFCLMASGPDNNNFLDISVLKRALDTVLVPGSENIVRLIGGEPLVHLKFLEILEMLAQNEQISSIEIITNGIGIENLIENITSISNRYEKPVLIRLSINYWLLSKNKLFSDEEKFKCFIRKYSSDYVKFSSNIAIRDGEEGLKQKWSTLMSSLKCWSSSVYLQEYVPGTAKVCEGLRPRRKLMCPHYQTKEKFIMPDGKILNTAEDAAHWMWKRSKYYGNKE